MVEDDVLLKMTPHTKAKHVILDRYLKAWLPILSKHSGRIVYVDGFAGPGEYDDGSPGSPIIALEVAKNHILKLAKEVVFLFVEVDTQKHQHLESLLDKRYGPSKEGVYSHLPENFRVHCLLGEFNTVIHQMLKDLRAKGALLAPTLAFVDPFGYSDINVEVLADILSFKKCELLITYMVGFLDRFAHDVVHRDPIRRSFHINDQEIDRIISIGEGEMREKAWLALLKQCVYAHIKEKDGRDLGLLDLSFKTIDRNNRTMYYLVYFTKHSKGVEVMKEAMFRVGRESSYCFSDYNFIPGQTAIVDFMDEKVWLRQAAEYVYNCFKERTVARWRIEKCVKGPSTPWIWRTKILEFLEKDGRILVEGNRTRSFTYPTGVRIVFK